MVFVRFIGFRIPAFVNLFAWWWPVVLGNDTLPEYHSVPDTFALIVQIISRNNTCLWSSTVSARRMASKHFGNWTGFSILHSFTVATQRSSRTATLKTERTECQQYLRNRFLPLSPVASSASTSGHVLSVSALVMKWRILRATERKCANKEPKWPSNSSSCSASINCWTFVGTEYNLWPKKKRIWPIGIGTTERISGAQLPIHSAVLMQCAYIVRCPFPASSLHRISLVSLLVLRLTLSR